MTGSVRMTNNRTAAVNVPSQQSFTRWHENPSEQKAFLDLVNTEGFALEDVVHETLSRCRHCDELHSNEVFEAASHRGGGRAEIDLWAKIGTRIFLIESKRSDYDLVFLQSKESKKDIHLIIESQQNTFVTNRAAYSHIPCVSKQVIEVLGADDFLTLQKLQKKPNLPIRSTRDEYVRNFLRQALFNTEILLHNQFNSPNRQKQGYRAFIPLIVTNAKLLSGTYSRSDIDNNAKLTKIEIEPIEVAAFNHAEILRWGKDYEQIIIHNGQPAHGNRLCDDERYKGSHNKTVFVVSKDHLLKFIDHTINWM